MTDDSAPTDDEIRAQLRADVDVPAATRARHLETALAAADAPAAEVIPLHRRTWQRVASVAAVAIVVAGVGGLVLVQQDGGQNASDTAARAPEPAEADDLESQSAESFSADAIGGEDLIGSFADLAELEAALGFNPDRDPAAAEAPAADPGAADPGAADSGAADVEADVGSDGETAPLSRAGGLADADVAPPCEPPLDGTGLLSARVGRAIVAGVAVDVFVVSSPKAIGASPLILVALPDCVTLP